MGSRKDEKWYHHNRYSADSACKHCEGIIRHERWCAEQNASVAYAFIAVECPAALSELDRIILHGLGASWT